MMLTWSWWLARESASVGWKCRLLRLQSHHQLFGQRYDHQDYDHIHQLDDNDHHIDHLDHRDDKPLFPLTSSGFLPTFVSEAGAFPVGWIWPALQWLYPMMMRIVGIMRRWWRWWWRWWRWWSRWWCPPAPSRLTSLVLSPRSSPVPEGWKIFSLYNFVILFLKFSSLPPSMILTFDVWWPCEVNDGVVKFAAQC